MHMKINDLNSEINSIKNRKEKVRKDNRKK